MKTLDKFLIHYSCLNHRQDIRNLYMISELETIMFFLRIPVYRICTDVLVKTVQFRYINYNAKTIRNKHYLPRELRQKGISFIHFKII